MKNPIDFADDTHNYSEIFPGSHISIVGNKSAVIDGCRQITECTDIMVRLTAGNYEIEIWGSCLRLTFFSEGSVKVGGIIEEIKINKKGAEKNQCF